MWLKISAYSDLSPTGVCSLSQSQNLLQFHFHLLHWHFYSRGIRRISQVSPVIILLASKDNSMHLPKPTGIALPWSIGTAAFM